MFPHRGTFSVNKISLSFYGLARKPRIARTFHPKKIRCDSVKIKSLYNLILVAVYATKDSLKIPEASLLDAMTQVLNYAAGKATLAEIQGQVESEWVEPEAELSEAETNALLNQPLDYDPEAWPSMESEEEMLACRDRLRPLVESWLASGNDIRKWPQASELSTELGKLRVRLFKSEGGSAGFRLVKPSGIGIGNTADIWALEFMFRYVTSSAFDRIVRCDRCKDYFWRQTKREGRKFCSIECGRSFHAVKQRKSTREAQRQSELKRLRREIIRFKRLSPKAQSKIFGTNGGIKRWLAQRPGILVRTNFITRAAMLGDLDLPKPGA